jgi:DNA excision repair protein ERCC-2
VTNSRFLSLASGTGKTVTLLSFILSYKLAHPDDCGKLIYCSRTVGECEKALEEAKVVVAHIQVNIDLQIVVYCNKILQLSIVIVIIMKEHIPNVKKFLIMGLSSRRNLCVHPRVKQEKYARVVDSKCRNMTAPWVRDSAGAGLLLYSRCCFLCQHAVFFFALNFNTATKYSF